MHKKPYAVDIHYHALRARGEHLSPNAAYHACIIHHEPPAYAAGAGWVGYLWITARSAPCARVHYVVMPPQSTHHSSLFARLAGGVVVFLILVVVAFGYLAYQKVRNGTAGLQDTEMSGDAPSAAETFTFPELSPDEQTALNPPVSFETGEGFGAFLSAVQRSAVSADTLAVGAECKVYPVVLKTTPGMTLEIKNYDSAPHTLTLDTFSGARSFSAPAAGSVSAPIDFGEAGSTYNISCDGRATPVGMLVIEGVRRAGL